MTDKKIRLRPPDYVVLGMVRLGAQSGYDIKKSVRDSIRFFWTISEAQIYPSLDRLERAGPLRAAGPAPELRHHAARRGRSSLVANRRGSHALRAA